MFFLPLQFYFFSFMWRILSFDSLDVSIQSTGFSSVSLFTVRLFENFCLHTLA